MDTHCNKSLKFEIGKFQEGKLVEQKLLRLDRSIQQHTAVQEVFPNCAKVPAGQIIGWEDTEGQ